MTISPVSPLPPAPGFAGRKTTPRFSGWLKPDSDPIVNVNTIYGPRQMRLSEANRLRNDSGGGDNDGDDDLWKKIKAAVKKFLTGE